MIKNIKIIKELKRLKKKPVNQIFLNSLKMRLEVLVKTNPVDERVRKPVHHTLRSIFKLRVVKVSFAVFMVTLLLGASAARASQGSLPGEKLYSIKIFTEEVRSKTTLKNKDRARLSMSFAAKRIKEIEEMLEETEIESDKLEIALNQFEKNLTKATNIMREEKMIIDDIGVETAEIHQDIKEKKEVLERTIREKKVRMEDKEKEIEEKIKLATPEEKENNETLIDELIGLKINKEILEFKEKDVQKILEDAEKTEEIKEAGSKNSTLKEQRDAQLKIERREVYNNREIIRSREEAGKEIRKKVLEKIESDRKEKAEEEKNFKDKDKD